MSVEDEARSLGWVPQEEFRGSPDKWVDAETFVERGKSVMPLLKATNARLEKEVARLTQLFQNSQEAIGELQKAHTEATARAVEQAKTKLMAELKAAREDGDVELEVQINDQLADLREAQREAKGGKETDKETPARQDLGPLDQDAIHPDLSEWMAENPWFGTDQRKTMRAMGMAQILRSDPENAHLTGRAFFDKVLEVMEEQTRGTRTDKVGETRHSGSGRAGGKTYADLPADAKAACDRQARKLVGEGRAYKDLASWQKYYAQIYFQGEA